MGHKTAEEEGGESHASAHETVHNIFKFAKGQVQLAADSTVEIVDDDVAKSIFWYNLLQYVSDNVLVMCVAVTAGSLGHSLLFFQRSYADPNSRAAEWVKIYAHLIDVGLHFGLMYLLRAVLLFLWRRSDEASAMRAVCTHSLTQLLPYLPRVAGGNMCAAIAGMLTTISQYDVYMATACVDMERDPNLYLGVVGWNPVFVNFLFIFCLACVWFYVCLKLSAAIVDRRDHNEPDASYLTYTLEILYVTSLSGSGKCFMLVAQIFGDATINQVIGNNNGYIVGKALWAVLATVSTFWMVDCGIARWRRAVESAPTRRARKHEAIIVANVEYAVVYWWAYIFVDFMWQVRTGCALMLTLMRQH